MIDLTWDQALPFIPNVEAVATEPVVSVGFSFKTKVSFVLVYN